MVSSLEMEPAKKDDDENRPLTTRTERSSEPSGVVFAVGYLNSLCRLIGMYVSYYRNITYPVLAALFIITAVLSLEFLAKASTGHRGKKITHDYSGAFSTAELKMPQVDHWCLQGDDSSCRCDDPTLPISNGEVPGWTKAHKLNKKAVEATSGKTYDLVFLGGSIVEQWNDRWLGTSPVERVKGIKDYWNKKFTLDGDGNIDALALGIAGDTTANLLWRVKHGEVTDDLNPKVWWIVIGENDLRRGQCSEEVVLLGILHMAEELVRLKPGSYVVINSLFRTKATVPVHHGHKELWPSIQSINAELKRFCEKHHYMHFFDTTSLFKTDVMDEDNHLTLKGYKVWGASVLREMNTILFDVGLADDEVATDDFIG